MALDKLVDSTQLDEALTATANALRTKGGTSSPIAWDATNGFTSAVEALPSGGGGWTLLTTDEVTVTTSSTTSTAVKNVEYTFENAIDPRDYVFIIAIVDKAGMRNGYFYCSTSFSVTGTSNGTVCVQCFRYNDNTLTGYAASGTGGYGIFAREVTYKNNKLKVEVYSRYNGTYSKTIDGTFTVKVYGTPWPSGANPLK